MSDGDVANSNEDVSDVTQSEESVADSSLALDDTSRNTTSSNTVTVEVGYWTAKITGHVV